MPRVKKIRPMFDKQQRRLIWTTTILTAISACLLLLLSWRLSRLDWLSPLSSLPALPDLFQGEVMSETPVAALPAFSGTEELSFLSSPDGRSFAYILNNQKSQQLVLNEKAEPIVENVTFMAFSPDSQSFAYTYRLDGQERASINGVSGKEYDWIFNPRFFTPDSRYFVYKARKDGKDMLVINSRESRSYDRIYEPFLAPDESALIFFARDGESLWRGEIPLAGFED
ncbi:MAG: hypothetical protein PHG95_03010 [Patescibacteria group bacterium]|nr:hypothetical protein [Patescibacteria group bacterium]